MGFWSSRKLAKKIESDYIIDSLKLLKKLKLSNRDLRKTTAKTLESNKTLRRSVLREVKKYQGVLTGKEKTFKVSAKNDLSSLKERGYKVEPTRKTLFIQRKENETVSASPKGDLTFSRILTDRKSGREVVETIFEPNISTKQIVTLDQFKAEILKQFPQNKMQAYAFTYYGNMTRESFSNIDDAFKKLAEYQQISNESMTVNDLQDAIKSFQLIQYQYVDAPDVDPAAVMTDLRDSGTIDKKFKKATKAKRNMK